MIYKLLFFCIWTKILSLSVAQQTEAYGYSQQPLIVNLGIL